MRKTQRKVDMYNELMFCYALDGNTKMQKLIEKRAQDDGVESFDQ